MNQPPVLTQDNPNNPMSGNAGKGGNVHPSNNENGGKSGYHKGVRDDVNEGISVIGDKRGNDGVKEKSPIGEGSQMGNTTIIYVISALLALLSGGLMYALFCGPYVENLEVSRLYFAAGVIGGLGFLSVFSIVVYVWGPPGSPQGGEPPGKVIFDACVKIIPPIVTLVLGYYFGTSKAQATSTRTDKPQEKTAVTPVASVPVTQRSPQPGQ